MKNYLMFALLIGAASTMAFGQITVACPDCTHKVSVYMGEGGLVAETEAESVEWLSTCNGVHVSGELEPNADGKVSMLFTEEIGLACASSGEKDGFELGPIMDGGWYWITDDMNSAVGGLVSKDILDNEAVTITSAGDGVTMTAGKGATYLKETATGRVGILPNILPEPPLAPATRCGFNAAGKKVDTECMLGDGKTVLKVEDATGQPFTGETLTRPAADYPDVTLSFYVVANGSGHYSVADTTPKLGSDKANPLATTFTLTATATGETFSDPTAVGLSLAAGSGNRAGISTLSISATAVSACDPGADPAVNKTVTATITAVPTAAQVVPAAKKPGAFSVSIPCPKASANMGTELVPENPFPTDR